jgi:hypothetical protein
MKTLFVLLAIVFSVSVSAEVYKWVDEEGRVHYGDRPGDSSNATRLPGFEASSPPPPVEAPSPKEPAPAAKPAETTPGVYSFPELFGDRSVPGPANYNISITTPLQDATVRDNQGIIPVAFTTTPMPDEDFSYQMYLDGEPWFQPFFSQQVYLSNVERGSHSIQVRLMDSEGTVVGESNSVTFHLHRASALNRNRN